MPTIGSATSTATTISKALVMRVSTVRMLASSPLAVTMRRSSKPATQRATSTVSSTIASPCTSIHSVSF